MTSSATQLLRALGSGIKPVGLSAPQRESIGAPGAFADLLKQAREGGLASELPVTIGSDAASAGVRLDDEQLARLAIAADKLETAGVRHALVTIDGQKLLLDVHSREVTGQPDGEHGLVGGIDGVMDLGDARASTRGAGVAPEAHLEAQGTPAGVRRIGPPAATLAGSASAMKLLAAMARNESVGNES